MATKAEFWQALRTLADVCRSEPPDDLVQQLSADLENANPEQIEVLRGRLAEMTSFLAPLCQRLLGELDRFSSHDKSG